MAVSGSATSQAGAVRDHGFHPLRVRRVVDETADARSFVLDVPPELQRAYAYEAGQFCTFRVQVDGQTHLRCYSMSSSPDVDGELQVTVKRVPGGAVSNWMNDTLAAGDVIDTSCPAGVFCLDADHRQRDVVAFAAGSGITPVYSLMKTALATTERRVRLLYANRDEGSVIFADGLDGLAEWYARRLDVVHHLDVESGFVNADVVRSFLGRGDDVADADVYICGPTPFMDIVEGTLLDAGVDPGDIHVERFTPAEPDLLAEPPSVPDSDGSDSGVDAGTSAPTRVTIELDGRTDSTDHRPGTTILQTARQMGMSPPFSCESGSCATCMGRVIEGAVTMHANNALTDDEVAEGWVLTCQSVPTTPTVHVIYGYE